MVRALREFSIFLALCFLFSGTVVSSTVAAAPADSSATTDISLETQFGSTTLSEAIVLDGGFDSGTKKNPYPFWNWNLGFARSRVGSQQSSASGFTTITNNTTDWTGGFGFTGQNGFGAEIGVLTSSTPEEELSATGGDVTFSYKFKFAYDDETDFTPSLKFRLKVGRKTYEQKFSATRTVRVGGRTVTRPTSGSVSLVDSFYRPSLTWRPIERWSVTLAYQVDVFNHDVAQFQNLLDSSRVLQSGAGGLGNTVGGLSQVTDSISVTRDVGEWLSIILGEAYSISATDLTPIYNTSLKFDFTFADTYSLVLGASYQSSNLAYDTIGTASFGVSF